MASRGVNKVILLGNLGSDPEIRYTVDNRAIATVSLATSDTWKDKNTGQQNEKTEWHRVVVYGPMADVVKQYLKKGSQVYFEGKLQTSKWQDQSGQDRYSTEVVVDGFSGQMQLLGGRSGAQQGMESPAYGGTTPPGYQQTPAPAAQNNPQQANSMSSGTSSPAPASGSFDDGDDIPF